MSNSDKENTHARNSPSAAARWMACPGSIKMSQNQPDTPGAAAQEGTLAHEVCEWMLKNEVRTIKKVNAGMGKPIDGEMFEHCLGYCKYIESLNTESVNVEAKVPLFYSLKETGTVDFWGVDKYGVLHIVDFKYGQGVRVTIQDNLQLIIYALSTVDLIAYNTDITLVQCHVYQPRMGNIGCAEYNFSDLVAFRTKIVEAEKASWAPDAPLKPTRTGCKWCKARAVCPAVGELNLRTIGSDFDNLDNIPEVCSQSPVNLSEDKLIKVLRHKDLIVSWMNEIERYIINRIVEGNQATGVALKRKSGRKVWKDEGKVIKLLTSIGMGGIVRTTLPTPLQTISAIRKAKKNIPSAVECEVLEKEGKLALEFESAA